MDTANIIIGTGCMMSGFTAAIMIKKLSTSERWVKAWFVVLAIAALFSIAGYLNISGAI